MPNTQQTKLGLPEFEGHTKPTQNNYEIIKDEMFWLRKELEDLRGEHSREATELGNLIFDLTEIVAHLAQKIEIWVGVAEE